MTSLRHKTIKAGIVLAVGKLAEQVLGFVRNLILANLLLPVDMGVAASLALSVAFLTTISNIAIETLLIQAPEGDEPGFVATAHSLELARGAIGALGLFVFADALAAGFQASDAAWAFGTLALVPLIRGMRHLDFVRAQREMRFGHYVTVSVVPQVAGVAAMWPLAMELRSYSAALWIAIGQVVLTVILSHALATRPYSLGWSRAVARKVWVFGAPLLINGCLLFLTMQGDNLIVGMWYGPAQLATYAIAAMIATNVSMLVNGVVGQAFLPLVSRSVDTPARYTRMSELSTQSFALIAVIVGTLGTLSAPLLVRVLFPDAYVAAAAPLSLLFLAHAVRILRFAPSLVATAQGRTRLLLEQTLAKLIFVPAAVCVATMAWPLTAVAACVLVAEVAAMFVAYFRTWRLSIYPAATWTAPLAVAGGSVLLAGAAAWVLGATGRSDVVTATVSVPLVIVGVAATLAVGTSLKSEMYKLMKAGVRRLPGRSSHHRVQQSECNGHASDAASRLREGYQK